MAGLSASPPTSEPTPCPPTPIRAAATRLTPGFSPALLGLLTSQPHLHRDDPHQGSLCSSLSLQDLKHLGSFSTRRPWLSISLGAHCSHGDQRKSTPLPLPVPQPHRPASCPRPVHMPLLPGTLLPHIHHTAAACLPGFLFKISFSKRLPSAQLFPVYSPGVWGPDPSKQGSTALLTCSAPRLPKVHSKTHTQGQPPHVAEGWPKLPSPWSDPA